MASEISFATSCCSAMSSIMSCTCVWIRIDLQLRPLLTPYQRLAHCWPSWAPSQHRSWWWEQQCLCWRLPKLLSASRLLTMFHQFAAIGCHTCGDILSQHIFQNWLFNTSHSARYHLIPFLPLEGLKRSTFVGFRIFPCSRHLGFYFLFKEILREADLSSIPHWDSVLMRRDLFFHQHILGLPQLLNGLSRCDSFVLPPLAPKDFPQETHDLKESWWWKLVKLWRLEINIKLHPDSACKRVNKCFGSCVLRI